MSCERMNRRNIRFLYRVKSLLAAVLLLLTSVLNAQYYPSPPPIRVTELPRLKAALKASGQDTSRVRLLLDLGNVYINKVVLNPGDIDSAIYFAQAARDLSVRLGYKSGYHYAQLARAEAIGEQFNIEKARSILNEQLDDSTRSDICITLSFKIRVKASGDDKSVVEHGVRLADTARAIARRNKLRVREVLALRSMNILQGYLGDPKFDEKMKALLQLCDEIGFAHHQYIYWEMASVYSVRGNGDKAIFYSTETLRKMKETGDSLHAADFYFVHGVLFVNHEDFEKGLYYLNMSEESCRRHRGIYSLPEILVNKVYVLRKQQKYKESIALQLKIMKLFPPKDEPERMMHFNMLGQIYRDMKDYTTAEKYLVYIFNHNKKNNNLGAGDYRSMGQLYVESGKYAQARPYLLKALSFPEELQRSGFTRHLYYLMFLTDSALGNYLSAMKYRNRYNDIVDNDLREKREKEIKRLSVLYETEKKEAEIKLKDQNIAVLEKDAALRQSQLKSEKQLRRFIIIAVLLLLIISLLLFRQYRMKRKSAEALAKTNDMILRKNEALARLVGEKEWLLKEVHHRVKNNLHTVICLLESQAAYLKNDALDAIHDSQHRIYAMSLIHQKLYQSDDRLIEMSAYLTQFIQYLGESFGSSDGIRFFHDIQPMLLSPVQSVPVALIVNETVTNAIKHAFPDGREGEISISLFEDEHHQITLEVADNGAGIDLSVLDRRSSSLGISLIRGLAKEIDGEVVFENRNGTVVTVSFMKDSIAIVSAEEDIKGFVKEDVIFA